MSTSSEKQLLIAAKMREILEILGLSSLTKTPERIAKMYVEEFFSALGEECPTPSFEKQKGVQGQIIKIENIQVTSLCEHHFVPMMGFATIAYIPARDEIVGLSYLYRLVRHFARRAQLQERLTSDIANEIKRTLATEDVAVTLSLTHFCVVARGVKDVASTTKTEALSGAFSNRNR